MSVFRQLVREVHERSVWQVLSIYLVAAWGALQVVEGITQNAGLPDWVPPFALVLLVIGLPIVVSTAVVQEGLPEREGSAGEPPTPEPGPNLAEGTGSLDRPSTRGSFLERHLTWRRSILGGVAAFALLGVCVAAYFLMRATGIGPVASLAAQGVFEEREAVILADFGNRTDDESLGDVVTQAFRVDLMRSPALTVLDPAFVAESLGRMQRASSERLTPDLAREVAVREGIKAVIQGEVGQAGEGYVLSATIVAADGRTLAAFRESSEDDSGVLEAIDRLSQDVREKAGESLRSIKAEEPLDRVTTASLPALRLFARADRAFERADYPLAISLLEEALELDPDFAMAWRRLAVVLNNTGLDRARLFEAARRAYELRDRLTPRERHLSAAFFNSQITQDRAEVIAAYRRVLDIDPDERAALNNLANMYNESGDLDQAAELYTRAVSGPGRSSTAFTNLIPNRVAAGDLDGARRVLADFRTRYPDNVEAPRLDAWIHVVAGDVAGALEAVRPLLDDPGWPVFARIEAFQQAAFAEYSRGHLVDARRYLEAAEELAYDAGPALGWVRTLWTSFYEIWLGDPDRAEVKLLDRLSDGTWDSLQPSSRFHFFTVMNLAQLGRSDEVEGVRSEWTTGIPEEARGRKDALNLESGLAMLEVQRGEAEAAVERLTEIREDWPCEVCFSAQTAIALRAAGDLDGAAREMERARSFPDPFVEVAFASAMWSLEHLGSVHEERGDTARAVEAYQRFAETWADADAEARPRVDRALERIRALEGR